MYIGHVCGDVRWASNHPITTKPSSTLSVDTFGRSAVSTVTVEVILSEASPAVESPQPCVVMKNKKMPKFKSSLRY